MLRFSQPQSSCLAVCSLPNHPAAEGELPRLRLGSQLWWRPHPCGGPYFLAWVSLLFYKGRAILCSSAMPSAHTPRSSTHRLACIRCFFPGPLLATACLPACLLVLCMHVPSIVQPLHPFPMTQRHLCIHGLLTMASFLGSFQDTPLRNAVVPISHLFLSKLPSKCCFSWLLVILKPRASPHGSAQPLGMVSSSQSPSWHGDSEPIPGKVAEG